MITIGHKIFDQSQLKVTETSLKMDNDKLVLEMCDCYVQEDSNKTEDQESDDDISLVNETGSIEDAQEANSSWNEHHFEKTDMVPFPDFFSDLNDDTEDNNPNKSACSKVDAWLSSNKKRSSKSLTERRESPKIKEVTKDAKLDTIPRGGVTEKRKLVFEDHLPVSKKLKYSPKESWLSSISGWMSDRIWRFS